MAVNVLDTTEKKLLDAAVQCLLDPSDAGQIRMARLAEIAGVSRAAAYKHFPGGAPAVIAAVNRWTIDRIIATARRGADIGGSSAAEALVGGIREVLMEFYRSETFQELSELYPEQVFTWLTDRSPGAVFSEVASFVGWCTRLHIESSDVSAPRLSAASERLVWSVVTHMISRWPVAGVPPPESELLDRTHLHHLVDTYLADLS